MPVTELTVLQSIDFNVAFMAGVILGCLVMEFLFRWFR